jgi:PAS domain S-box-containing protein
MTKVKTKPQPSVEELKARLQELEDTLEAIRGGAVDAIIAPGPAGDQVYTLNGADHAYYVLVESINEGAVTLLPNGTILYSNRQFGRIIGSSPSGMVGRRFHDFVHASDQRTLDEIIKRAGSDGSKAEIRLAKGSADEITVLISASLVELNCMKTLALVVTDLTDRKKIENELRLHGTIMANMSEGISLVRVIDSRIVYANPKFDSMFGYKSGELIGQHVSVINAPGRKNPEETAEDIISALRQKGTWSGEVQNRKKDDSVFWCSANVSTFKHPDHGEVWLGVHSDITTRKKAEQELWNNRRFLSDIIEHSGAIIFTKDLQGRHVLFNQKWAEVTGLRRLDSLGKTDEELFGASGKQFRLHDMEAVESRRAVEREEILETADGKRSFISVKFPLVGEDDNVIGVCGMSTEITERKKIEDELNKNRQKLEEMVEERTQELESKTQILEELNTTLRVMLRQRDEDKRDLEERFVANIKTMILPYAEKMKGNHLDEKQKSFLSIMETHLNEIMSPLLKNLHQFNLTPTEVQVASHIKDGRPTKEIAKIMGIAPSSVDTHRKRIRKKLGLSRANNLRSNIHSLTK